MTKTELIDHVAEKTDMTKKDCDKIINATFDSIMDYLEEEADKEEEQRDKVQIIGFGSFEVRDRQEREGRNPQNPEETITIPARSVPVFRAGKTFKEAVK
ncbi:HU family DNA-binding protein [Halarsenatibacter silvermanii]|uniref:DNA-binding protein HU-beta n=1 Tax=Halarsenatibacter silvermanii TaxID=321763 RepID=A0A1G9NWG1_9FIRM|nr:HU family DNA-binding protein [Halarsenatibacter silvermanii]SDL90315.1 DNA-binding protein HU-beta [Halarsenatibacter silvermanii]